ncbi:MAG: MoxR family ATPase [Dehalococcoidales bacterium]|nr:MoxR family ATPase [Dehalococcoidales bacterium]
MANNSDSIDTTKASTLRGKILSEISKAVIGKDNIKEALLVALIAGGHILIEGLPGTAKTTLSKSFAEVIGGSFKRIQFTPDMMPADITGFYMYSTDGSATFVDGPVFANVVLADELNRTTPRTQSAMIEAMQEHQVTVEKKTFQLPRPFMVIATQVLSGEEGTYSLTNVQIDRFMLRVWSPYLTHDEEKEVISNIDRIDTPEIRVAATLEEINEIQYMARQVYVSPDISEYIISLIGSLRSDPDVLSGPSTRSGIALYKCARVMALFDNRDYVIPDDIKHLASQAIEHRLRVKVEAEMDDITPAMILQRTLEKVPVPKLE